MRVESERYSRYFTYIKPLAKLPIIRTYGSIIFTILTIIIFILFAIKPTVETILVLQKKLDNAGEVLTKLKKKANDLTLGKQNYENLDANIKLKIETALPDSVELKSLIKSLESAALKNQASISALQIQPLTLESRKDNQLGTLAEVSFTFNIAGTYPNLISLLKDLQTSDRLISIDNLSVSKLTEEDIGGLIMSLSGKTYFIK